MDLAFLADDTQSQAFDIAMQVDQPAVVRPMSNTQTQTFLASDGTRLTYDQTAPIGPTKHAVIALHSFGDYRAAYDHIAPVLAKHGIETFALDQRGFGKSGEFGVWAGTQRIVDDVLEFTQLVRSKIGLEVPISLIGESMGGGTALIAAQRRPENYSRLVLAAPAVRDELPFRWAYDAALAVGEAVMPQADKALARDDNPLLLNATAKRLETNPLVVRDVSVDMYKGLVDLTDAASAAARQVTQPTLIFYGSKDETIHPKSVRVAASALKRGQFCFLDGAPHLALQWKESAPIIEAAAAWLVQSGSDLPCDPDPEETEQKGR